MPFSFGQINILATNPRATEVLTGNFNPDDFEAQDIIDHPADLVREINSSVNPDTLKAYLIRLAKFHNRNTGSDTVSETRGIGAARRWVFSKFEEFSRENDGRLIPSYLQFNQTMCGVNRHRNIFAVLPGRDTSNHQVIIIEGHMDSRCEVLCDIDCLAEGVEDNASGTALVIELARVMSRLTFNQTFVFLVTIGEEQGLYGAAAFAQYCLQQRIPVKAVMNNDIVGGVICGKTSSPPSCPGENEIDSTQIRLFSSGFTNSLHKQWARYIKLQYQEELLPIVKVPMMVTIMSGEDRSGRGGDHIPFRERGFTAMRFTSANEHGHGAPNAGYTDRQHTEDDVLGIDTNIDGEVDSFFVDFNYLARNTVINGVAGAMVSVGVKTPAFTATNTTQHLEIIIDDPMNYDHYRIFFRTGSNDFDTILTVVGTKTVLLPRLSNIFTYISVAAVDSNGVESCFSREFRPLIVGIEEQGSLEVSKKIELIQNKPNPFDEATFIPIWVHDQEAAVKALVIVSDLSGKEIKRIPLDLHAGYNEVLYEHGYGVVGTYVYSLVIDGQMIDSKSMVFAN